MPAAGAYNFVLGLGLGLGLGLARLFYITNLLLPGIPHCQGIPIRRRRVALALDFLTTRGSFFSIF